MLPFTADAHGIPAQVSFWIRVRNHPFFNQEVIGTISFAFGKPLWPRRQSKGYVSD